MDEIILKAAREIGLGSCTAVRPFDGFDPLVVVGRSPKIVQGRIPAAYLLEDDLRRVKTILAEMANSVQIPVNRSW